MALSLYMLLLTLVVVSDVDAVVDNDAVARDDKNAFVDVVRDGVVVDGVDDVVVELLLMVVMLLWLMMMM